MSRKSNCYDNTTIENFFGILKQEIYCGYVYKSFGELEMAVSEFIKYYNEDRIKEDLDWLSPVQYRQVAIVG
jgi:transposase InsO family protein